MKILYHGTYGTDDPTRASFPFVYSRGAIEAGHEPTLFLAGEATYLMRPGIAEAVQGFGIASLKELLQSVREHSVPVYVWGLCGKARGVTDADLEPLQAKWGSPKLFAELTAASDRVISL